MWIVEGTKIQVSLCVQQKKALGCTLHIHSFVFLILCTSHLRQSLNLNESEVWLSSNFNTHSVNIAQGDSSWEAVLPWASSLNILANLLLPRDLGKLSPVIKAMLF